MDISDMTQWTILYNPKCSKCREALALLQSKKIEPQVIEYLKNPLTKSEVKEWLSRLDSPATMVRTKEEDFQAAPFDLNSTETIAKRLAENPKLIERPVIMNDKQAVVARPIEKMDVLFNGK
jgi:arsenate reductase